MTKKSIGLRGHSLFLCLRKTLKITETYLPSEGPSAGPYSNVNENKAYYSFIPAPGSSLPSPA